MWTYLFFSWDGCERVHRVEDVLVVKNLHDARSRRLYKALYESPNNMEKSMKRCLYFVQLIFC